MISFTPCHADHFKYVVHQSVQSEEYRSLWTGGYREKLADSLSLTAWASGECLGMAGVLEVWSGVGEAWALLGPGARSYLLPIVRRMRYVLGQVSFDRVHMIVAEGNGNGHALAKLCGFEYETKLEKYHYSGADAHMYKRIRH